MVVSQSSPEIHLEITGAVVFHYFSRSGGLSEVLSTVSEHRLHSLRTKILQHEYNLNEVTMMFIVSTNRRCWTSERRRTTKMSED